MHPRAMDQQRLRAFLALTARQKRETCGALFVEFGEDTAEHADRSVGWPSASSCRIVRLTRSHR